MGGAIPWLVVVGSIRKKADQATRSKSVSSILLLPLHQFLPPSFCPVCAPELTAFEDELLCEIE